MPHLPVVEYRIEFKADAGTAWEVQRLHLVEEISQPFRAVADVVTDDETASIDALLGSSVNVTLKRDGHERRLAGLVVRVERTGRRGHQVLVRVYIAPALALCAQRGDTRIFQEKSAPEIIKEVLDKALGPLEREIRLDLSGSYEKREYCVQYGESDLNFVGRLMEEEGIAYAFDFAGENEVVVFFDGESAGEVTTMDGAAVPIVSGLAQQGDVEGIQQFAWALELTTTEVVVREFDWMRPAAPLSGQSGEAPAGAPALPIYQHSGAALISNVKPRAKSQAELRAARHKRGLGQGIAIGFSAGQTFELSGHAVSELDQKYIITRVEHRGAAPALIGGSDLADDAVGYENHFECQPTSLPYRPPMTLVKPRIHGLQTAIVTGAGGEEIHTDAHGRIKVQFHWDRQGGSDDKSSCWIRVAQNWAGPGWGFSFVPRIGMEVLVSFLDGDPDRPMVVGCVYNGANPPPYALPGEKTKSGIRTSSSMGGGGCNELTFEDAAGSELVFFQAQKDKRIEIKNDKLQHVGRHENLQVDGNRDRTVDGNQTMHVKGNDQTTVDKNQNITIAVNREESVGSNQTLNVGGNRSETVAVAYSLMVGAAASIAVGGALAETVGGMKSEAVGGAKSETIGAIKSVLVAGNVTEKVGGNVSIVVGKDHTLQVTKNHKVEVVKDSTTSVKGKGQLIVDKELGISAKKITIEAKDELAIKVGSAQIVMKKNGDITIKGGKISVEGSKDVKIKGSKVAEN